MAVMAQAIIAIMASEKFFKSILSKICRTIDCDRSPLARIDPEKRSYRRGHFKLEVRAPMRNVMLQEISKNTPRANLSQVKSPTGWISRLDSLMLS